MTKQEYADYLRSKHWQEFRQGIRTGRHVCQNCGKKDTLNIHHKHYKSLGCETNDDVIVLCQECHFRFHSKLKRRKKRLTAPVMDFTGVKNPRLVYDSNVKEKCPRCGDMHGLFYNQFPDKIRLGSYCPNSKPRIRYIRFRPGLDIPMLGAKQLKT